MPPRPSPRDLERFLLGTLPPADAARVAAWVSAAPEAAETLRGLAAADTFTDSLRAGARGSTAAATQPAGPAATVARAPAPAPAKPFPPAELGGFRVVRELGRGGMGAVFEATDPALGRKVALKVMLPAVASDPRARGRFLREARAVAKVENDHIVPIYQVGEADGVPFIAMPLLAGETLTARLQAGHPLPVPEVLMIGRQLADGLAAAHGAGLIHRDIKPSNVWLELTANGAVRRARVLDFGLARAPGDAVLTGAGDVLGTPAYMSVEQARGQPVDFRTDLYSLGVVLYEMATGRRAFAGVNVLEILTLLATHTPAPPGDVNPALPAALSDLIVRLMSKTPAGRPQSARAVADELARITAPVPPPVPGSRPNPPPVPAGSGPRPALPDTAPEWTPEPPTLPIPKATRQPEPLSLDDEPDPAPAPLKPRSRRRWAAAVALVLLAGTVTVYQLTRPTQKTPQSPPAPAPTARPKVLVDPVFEDTFKADLPLPRGWRGDAFGTTKDAQGRACVQVTKQTGDHFMVLPPDVIAGVIDNNFAVEGEYALGSGHGHKITIELESSSTKSRLTVVIGLAGDVWFADDDKRLPNSGTYNSRPVKFRIERQGAVLSVKLNDDRIYPKDLKDSKKLDSFDTVRIGLPGEVSYGFRAKLYSLKVTLLPD